MSEVEAAMVSVFDQSAMVSALNCETWTLLAPVDIILELNIVLCSSGQNTGSLSVSPLGKFLLWKSPHSYTEQHTDELVLIHRISCFTANFQIFISFCRTSKDFRQCRVKLYIIKIGISSLVTGFGFQFS